MEEDTSYCTYGEAYEVNCARYGRQPDQPIVLFKKKICNEQGKLLHDASGELRQQVQSACSHAKACICLVWFCFAVTNLGVLFIISDLEVTISLALYSVVAVEHASTLACCPYTQHEQQRQL